MLKIDIFDGNLIEEKQLYYTVDLNNGTKISVYFVYNYGVIGYIETEEQCQYVRFSTNFHKIISTIIATTSSEIDNPTAIIMQENFSSEVKENIYQCYFEEDYLMVPINAVLDMFGESNFYFIYVIEGHILKIGPKVNIEAEGGGYIEIDLNTGEVLRNGFNVKDVSGVVLPTLPKRIGNIMYVPLMETYSLVTTSNIFFDKSSNLVRYNLQDFELEFLKDFPYVSVKF